MFSSCLCSSHFHPHPDLWRFYHFTVQSARSRTALYSEKSALNKNIFLIFQSQVDIRNPLRYLLITK